MEPCIQLISTFTLAGVALLVGFLGPRAIERWKHKFYAPDLFFEFEFGPPWCHLTSMWMGKVKYVKEDTLPAYYFRFSVGNNGKVRADDCEAALEKVWKEDDEGNLCEWPNFSPVGLLWSGEEDHLKTIHPGRKGVFCDIGRINHPKYKANSIYRGISETEKQENIFFFTARKIFYSQWDCLVPGKYQIQISVYSKNAKRITKRFKISWSGKWKDIEEEMFKEIEISLE